MFWYLLKGTMGSRIIRVNLRKRQLEGVLHQKWHQSICWFRCFDTRKFGVEFRLFHASFIYLSYISPTGMSKTGNDILKQLSDTKFLMRVNWHFVASSTGLTQTTTSNFDIGGYAFPGFEDVTDWTWSQYSIRQRHYIFTFKASFQQLGLSGSIGQTIFDSVATKVTWSNFRRIRFHTEDLIGDMRMVTKDFHLLVHRKRYRVMYSDT
jgi:hypothetical protein